MRKEWTETVIKKYIYINTLWQIAVPHGSKLHILPTNYHFLDAKQEPYQTVYPSTSNIEEFSEKKNQENGPVDRKKTRQKQLWE